MSRHLPSPPGVKRAAVLAYVRQQIEAGAPSPTIREIGDAVGISSTSVVNYHLARLIRDGEIRRIPGISRGLVLTGAPVVPVALGADVVVVIDGHERVGVFAGLAA